MFPKGEKLRKKYFVGETVRVMHKTNGFFPNIFYLLYKCFITGKRSLKMTPCKLTYQDAIRF